MLPISYIPKNERQGWFIWTTLDARFSPCVAAGRRAICRTGACYRKPISHTWQWYARYV